MLRKIVLIAAAVAIPMGATAVSAVAQSGTAGATALAITCKSTAGAVNFASPGVSNHGSFSSSPTSTTTTTTSTFSCGSAGTGTAKPQNIVTNSTQCTGTNTPVTGCTAGQYNYDSTNEFTNSASTLWQSLPKLKVVVGATTYTSKSSSSSATVCSGGEAGFVIKGKLTAPAAHAGEATKLSVCLGSDSGPGTTGSFTNDYVSASGGNTGITIAKANFASDTKLKIS